MKKLFYLSLFALNFASCVAPNHDRSGYFDEGFYVSWEQESDNDDFMRELYVDVGMNSKNNSSAGYAGFHLGVFYSAPNYDFSFQRNFHPSFTDESFSSIKGENSARWYGSASIQGEFNYIFFKKRINRIRKICFHCPKASYINNQGYTHTYAVGPQYFIRKPYRPLVRLGLKAAYFSDQYSIPLHSLSPKDVIYSAGGKIIVPNNDYGISFQQNRGDVYTNVRSHVLSLGFDYSIKKYLRFNSSNRRYNFGKARFFNLYANLLIAPAHAFSQARVEEAYDVYRNNQIVQTVLAGNYDIKHAEGLKFNPFGANIGFSWRTQNASTDAWWRNFGWTVRMEGGIRPQARGYYSTFNVPLNRAYTKMTFCLNLNFNTKNKVLVNPFVE